MRFFLLVILLFSNSLFAQTNEIYKLLKWSNVKEQQQLIAWYDLQDASVVKRNSSNPGNVYGINDKGIWKNHITQQESIYQPKLITYDGFANGPKNGISFSNGGYMVYKFPREKFVTAITSFVVCKNDIGGSKLLYDLSKEGGEGIASCYSGLNKIESRVPNSLADFEPNFRNNPEKILIISTKGSSGKISSYLNSTNYSGPGSRTFQGTSYNRIRLSTENDVAPTDGILYELILFNYELNDEDFNTVKNYLENKYKINSTTTQNSNNSYKSSLIEGKVSSTISNTTTEISYVRLGEVDVLTSDIGEMTYDDAKNAIKNLGTGWRLPNEKELKLMFNNQDKIGALSKREFKVVQDYWIYAGNYLGEEPNGQLVLLRTLVDPGYTITYNKSGADKRKLTYVRAVRDAYTKKEKTTLSSTEYAQMFKTLLNSGGSSNSKSNNTNSKPVSNKCEYCGNRFSDIGYSIYHDEIIEGKYKDPLTAQIGYEQFGGKGKISNAGNYCKRKCAVDAYKSGARDKSIF